MKATAYIILVGFTIASAMNLQDFMEFDPDQESSLVMASHEYTGGQDYARARFGRVLMKVEYDSDALHAIWSKASNGYNNQVNESRFFRRS